MGLKFDSGKVEKLVENIKEIKNTGVQAILIDYVITELESCRETDDICKLSLFFESCWKEYPNKRGKSGVTMKAKKELLKAGNDVHKAIENYIKTKPEWASYLDGSTFFNGRWKDYVNPEETEKPSKKKSLANYQERIYSDEYLNGFIGGNYD